MFIFLGNAHLAVFRRFPGKIDLCLYVIVKFSFSIPMSDGDWDWYNYSRVVLETSQRRDFKCTCLAGVHFNVWCAIGNMIHVVHSHLLKKEVSFSLSLSPSSFSLSLSPSLFPSPLFHSYLQVRVSFSLQSTFSVHAAKKAEVSHMVPVGDGVWISFKFDSTLRLFHGTTLTCMQDLDIGPSVQRILGECSPYSILQNNYMYVFDLDEQ